MIVIRLKGGLGNQMFQYAFGRYLSLKNNDILKLDISFLEKPAHGYTQRKYELGVFNIDEKFARKEETPFVVRNNCLISKFLLKFFKKNLHMTGVNYCPEESLPRILKTKGNLYLDGYWQNHYFPDAIRSRLIKEFSLKNRKEFLKGKNRKVIKEIKSSSSVSVHIRRTDYISIKNNRQAFSCCDKAYYQRAMKKIKEVIKRPKFFFFSDDTAWVKKSIEAKDAVYIDWNKETPCYDMVLMSNCQNHIIANSTFSWWGAWLNSKANKNVVVPRLWNKKDESKNKIIPSRWLKI
jgi:hypothetical protein